MANDQRSRRRYVYGLVCSSVLHVALFAFSSFGSCLTGLALQASAADIPAVSVDILAPPAAATPLPALPRTVRPGGGVASHRPGRTSHPSEFAPQVVVGPVAEPAAAQPDPLLAQATSDDGLEVPATPPSDGEAAAVAPVPQAPAAVPTPIAPQALAAAPGTGPGAHGGPGGLGHGARRASLPVVVRDFALGSGEFGDFKAVVCFIQPGTLRIADVHRCDPAAVFYTDTFNIPERQYTQGFPGVTGRSSWFMIDYRGSFGVSQDGTYRFRLHSDDGAYLYIDGALVVENDGKHEPISQEGDIQLRAGRHQLKLLYAQTVDRMALQLFVRVPNSRRERLFTSEL